MADYGGSATAPASLRNAIVLFALVVVGASLCNLSQTGLNAMISPVMADQGIDVDTGQWLTSAYILVLGVAVPVAAFLQRRLSDRAFALSWIFWAERPLMPGSWRFPRRLRLSW